MTANEKTIAWIDAMEGFELKVRNIGKNHDFAKDSQLQFSLKRWDRATGRQKPYVCFSIPAADVAEFMDGLKEPEAVLKEV